MYSQNDYLDDDPLFKQELKNKRKWHQKWWGRIIIISVVLFLILAVAVGIYISRVAYLLKTNQIDAKSLFSDELSNQNVEPAPLPNLFSEDDPSRGPKNAKVTIVEFGDFQCTACEQAYPVIKEFLRNYGDQVRFIYRDFPDAVGHPLSVPAAMAGKCAHEQGGFWEMYDKIFQNQQSISLENFKIYASQIGLEISQFDNCMDKNKYVKKIQQDYEEGFNLGVRATPTFFVNRIQISGAMPLDVLEQAVVGELNKNN